MKRRSFAFHEAAKSDLVDIWQLIADRDGPSRADSVYGRIEAFCRSLGEFALVGTQHNELRAGLRSVGVPGLKRTTVLFIVTDRTVTVIRVGYLGRNIWQELPE